MTELQTVSLSACFEIATREKCRTRLAGARVRYRLLMYE
jgi:hypothetical protein